MRLTPELLERAREGPLFPLRVELSERGGGGLPRESARGELALEPVPAISPHLSQHERAGGGEVIQPPLALEPVEGLPHRDFAEPSLV